MKTIILAILIVSAISASAQSKLSKKEFSINGFRNPSIGLEYRLNHFSVHAGYYPTNFTSGVTTSFVRTGISYWFLPVGNKENPSSFYSSASFARGLDREYENKNALMAEVGFRWMIVKGLNFRLGLTALMATGEDVKINPTPGLSYSFFIK